MALVRTATILPAELPAENVTAIIDTREQLPLDLAPLRMERGTLVTGDYSIKGLEHVVSLERKSLDDLLGCIGSDRERFDREVQRLLGYPVRCLIVESSWQELERGGWRSKVSTAAAIGSCLGWIAAGLPIIMAGTHQRAGQFAGRILYTAARRRWREARELFATAIETDPPKAPESVGAGSRVTPSKSIPERPTASPGRHSGLGAADSQ